MFVEIGMNTSGTDTRQFAVCVASCCIEALLQSAWFVAAGLRASAHLKAGFDDKQLLLLLTVAQP
jgi:hypothetical protein